MARAEGEQTLKPLRQSGRPCGCDPQADHVCAQHAGYIDETETEITVGYQLDSADTNSKQSVVVVVNGPDRDGDIGVLGADCLYLSRFAAEDLANEILRRLGPRLET